MSTELRLPQLAETVTSAKLAAWLKQEGDSVEEGEPIVEVETDKTNVEIASPATGVIDTIHVEAGADGLETGTLLAVIGAGAARPAQGETPASAAEVETPAGEASDTAAAGEPPAAPEPPPPGSEPAGAAAAASPLARRMAAAAGIDLATIRGTGRGGRIGKADVERAIGAQRRTPAPEAPPPATPPPTAVTRQTSDLAAAEQTYRDEPLSAMRRVTATRLQQAKQSVPHFYLRVDCRVDAALALRSRINAELPDTGLTLTGILVRAAALALRRVPQANSTWADNALRVYAAADIAVAVDTPQGLITPIIRGADRKGLGAIARELQTLSERARAGALTPDEYTGGTFTISNLGMYGVESLYAIVNPPQSCILGVGAAVRRPVVIGDELAVGTVSTCTLSADHRAIDGATGARLLAAFRQFIEEPGLLAL